MAQYHALLSKGYLYLHPRPVPLPSSSPSSSAFPSFEESPPFKAAKRIEQKTLEKKRQHPAVLSHRHVSPTDVLKSIRDCAIFHASELTRRRMLARLLA